MIGDVYIIQGKRLGIIKIGMSMTVEERFESLERSGPWPLRMVGVITESKKHHEAYGLEGEYHEIAQSRRMHGEWFRFTLMEIAEIEVAIPMGDRCVARVLRRLSVYKYLYNSSESIKGLKLEMSNIRESVINGIITEPDKCEAKWLSIDDASAMFKTTKEHIMDLGHFGVVRISDLPSGKRKKLTIVNVEDLVNHARLYQDASRE